ncbi:MAG TPA: TlpA disulfide reductase family protein [Gemmatimonadaceae bacterium]|nr:TlpA disulfide reductase family protein [Gemmatimonadaceae bacterium]
MRATRLVGAIACALAACACTSDARTPAPAQRVEVGAPAPPFAAVTLDGDSASLAALRGRPVLLNVWATWCHPCRDEIPVLQALHERYGARGLALVGVSVDAEGEASSIREFAREFRMTYPIWLDPAERVSTTFLTVGVPTTFLIGKDGTLRWRRTGPVHATDSTLLRAIDRELGS